MKGMKQHFFRLSFAAIVSSSVACGASQATATPEPTLRPGVATATMLPQPAAGECHFTSHSEAVTASGAAPAKGDSVIKGMPNDGGERVYFVPGMRRYPSLKVEADKGGQWFCTEQAAIAARFKASTSPRDPFPTATVPPTPTGVRFATPTRTPTSGR